MVTSIRTGVEHEICREDGYWYKENRCINMSLQSKIYEIAEKISKMTDLKITQPTSSAVIIINLMSFKNPKDAERERERGKSVCSATQ
jgi:hypothetical protein